MPGYEVTFVNRLLKQHECPICHLAMKNPVQTECGHLFCRDCLDSTLSDQMQPICPVDMEEINIDNIFRDNAIRREILNLEVYCRFKSGGCCWSGTLKSLEDHLSKCEHREVQCSQCGQIMPNHIILKAHQDSECPKRLQSQANGDSDTSHSQVQQEQSTNEDESQFQSSTDISAPVQESEQRGSHSFLHCFAPLVVYGNQLWSRVRAIEKKLAQQKEHMLNLEASMASTYNGSFTWKIDNLKRCRRDAVNGKELYFHSSPFYTSKNGYKMCIRVYLNGDGIGYKTHLSLLFVLMKGEFDALLKWPFDNKVSLVLVDQNHCKHIVQTFKPTPESSSFQRPITDMNVASGCPRFCKLSFLDDENYTKDDVLFVKCIVDTSRIFHP